MTSSFEQLNICDSAGGERLLLTQRPEASPDQLISIPMIQVPAVISEMMRAYDDWEKASGRGGPDA